MDFKEWDIHHLISFLGLTEKQIKYFSYNRNSKTLYRKFKIAKKNWWFRQLMEPWISLKTAQKKILNDILYNYDWLLPTVATWFRRGKSIINNASFHKWKSFIIKLDIQDFFPSISRDRVFGLFYRSFDFSYEVSDLLAWICTYKNQLPQGAPTSPMIANLIARRLDYRLIGLLKKLNELNPANNFSYSRYADDLTISFSKIVNTDNLINIVNNILQQEGFILNTRKIRVISSNYNQSITWITVNNKISLWKPTYRKWRAILYNIRKIWWNDALIKWNNFNNSALDIQEFKTIIYWYKNYFSMVFNQSHHESLALKSLISSFEQL